jgi:hypothetical protein
MELQCPNCGSTDLKKVSLAYEEGLSRIKAKSRLKGLSFGDGEPNVIVGTATTHGSAQTALSNRLRPPKKWSYLKLLLWAGLLAMVALVVCVRLVMRGSAPVSAVPIVMAGVVGLATFVIVLFATWRHNQAVYPRQFAEWNRSWVCASCGKVTA